MNEWFEKRFLPSLFERTKNSPLWLSCKQTAICVRNFSDSRTVVYENECGVRYHRLIFTHTWQNRPITLIYSKLNGCGQIIFGYTPEETEQFKRELKEAEKAEHLERLERIKKGALVDKIPKYIERYNRRIIKFQTELALWKEMLQEDIEDKLSESIEIDKQTISEIETDLNYLLN